MNAVQIDGITLPVSRVVLGTDWFNARRFFWIAGRQLSSPFVDRQRQQSIFDLLDGVFEAGCNAFDTARAYRDSEEVLGAWIQARRVRDRVVIITKGAHPGPGWTSRLTVGEISRDLQRSLKALRTDYIDVYLLHYDDGTSEVGPLVEMLNSEMKVGRIRSYGLSNWPTQRIALASSYARAKGLQAPVVSSVQFSLAEWRYPPWKNALTLSGENAEADRRWYKESSLCLLAYSSLAMGFFSRSRSYADGTAGAATPTSRLGDQVFLNDANLARLERANEIARRRGVTAGQVALAWVFGFDPRILAVVGARNVASYADAVRACELTLTETERTWLLHGA